MLKYFFYYNGILAVNNGENIGFNDKTQIRDDKKNDFVSFENLFLQMKSFDEVFEE